MISQKPVLKNKQIIGNQFPFIHEKYNDTSSSETLLSSEAKREFLYHYLYFYLQNATLNGTSSRNLSIYNPTAIIWEMFSLFIFFSPIHTILLKSYEFSLECYFKGF